MPGHQMWDSQVKREPLWRLERRRGGSPRSPSDNGYYRSGAGRRRPGAATVEADESLLRPTRFRSQRIPVEANDPLLGRQLRNRKTWPKPTVVEHQRSCCSRRILAKHRNVCYPHGASCFTIRAFVEKRRRSRRGKLWKSDETPMGLDDSRQGPRDGNVVAAGCCRDSAIFMPRESGHCQILDATNSR